MGWASFNDQFRDGLKGNGFNVLDKGFLFGKWRENDNHDFLKRIILGSRKEFGGQYIEAYHSVNYLECHDNHPLKYIDREMYFRLEENGSFISKSGCGNDTRSESPPMSLMILESVKYWMTEYHIDGFRFDLGNLIDPKTRKKNH